MTATGVHFCLWAPTAQTVKVVLFAQGCPTATYALNREEAGYWSTDVAGGGRGARYAFSVDGGEPRPDPASRSQPEGVHAPSEVIDPRPFVGMMPLARHPTDRYHCV
jgi:maltooligosyltrehalose trehalohydrolase